MKKFKNGNGWTVFIVIVVILVLLGCGGAYLYFTGYFNNNEDVVIDNAPIFTKENYPIVDGSTVTIPLSEAFIKNFTGDETAEVTHATTHNAYMNLINGKSDLILVTQPSEDELAEAQKAGFEYEIIPVVYDAFVFMVNKDNPIEGLTIKQIQDIYQGKITNWKEVGGADEEIIAFQRPENSGSQTGMLNLVMKGLPLTTPPIDRIPAAMGDLIDSIASYNNANNALGYSYYYFAKLMYSYDTIKFISVDDVMPNYDNIKSGAYPFNTAYYIVIDKAEPKDGPVRQLVNAMLSVRGQNIAKEAGYVPVK